METKHAKMLSFSQPLAPPPGLKALNNIVFHMKNDMMDSGVTDKAVIVVVKRQEQLLCDKYINHIYDSYHLPDGFYALDIMIVFI
mmetsp:Transcript_59624/g.106322  ORF Transcript_59624/g.106322 Transcript_59624/m.106322 type:complete len:85 (-) Transcript_59624:289-543(-)